MKRTTFTVVTLFAFGFTAIAAGPTAPTTEKESSSPAPSTPSRTTTQPPAATSSPTTGSSNSGANSGAAQSTSQAKKPVSGADQAFIQKAAELNLYELEMSKAAARISTSPDIRQAAQSMTRDLTTVRQQLESLAASKGITLPKALPQELRDKLTAAESRTGSQFDQNYLTDQITVKQQIISLYERDGTHAGDIDIQTWSKQTVPSLKNHLSILKKTTPPAVGEKTQPDPMKKK